MADQNEHKTILKEKNSHPHHRNEAQAVVPMFLDKVQQMNDFSNFSINKSVTI